MKKRKKGNLLQSIGRKPIAVNPEPKQEMIRVEPEIVGHAGSGLPAYPEAPRPAFLYAVKTEGKGYQDYRGVQVNETEGGWMMEAHMVCRGTGPIPKGVSALARMSNLMNFMYNKVLGVEKLEDCVQEVHEELDDDVIPEIGEMLGQARMARIGRL